MCIRDRAEDSPGNETGKSGTNGGHAQGFHPVQDAVLQGDLFLDVYKRQGHQFSIRAGIRVHIENLVGIRGGNHEPAIDEMCIRDSPNADDGYAGASDDLTAGQSTFMVEMSEVADIVKHATKNLSLIHISQNA